MKYNAYKVLEQRIIDGFFTGTDEQIRHGRTILEAPERKLIKKRLGGSREFRTYLLSYAFEGSVYLVYVYPKTGAEGKISLNKRFTDELVDEAVEAIKRNAVYELTVHNGKLHFDWLY
ncbi:hypothetical protein [Dyadobacter sandarakinus]|uniref:Type II toxin-antitoxin system RelE/ParE family toxin n=1 Tax=Dyadobacter sandarakinus TaxID=2747268 RepID=A0ABX7I3J9_9BACT|nr:hypothetical protein [Dyadobacter sandarakinus]QRR00649.1 hypothetical protein HWI92_06870 [Dyadobacter sandarakinus]